MEYEVRRPWLPVLAGVLAIILVALLVVAGLEPWDHRVSVQFVSYGGGSFQALAVEPGTVLEGSMLPRPSKTGMRFAGWCVDEACTQLYSGQPISRDSALYAAYVEPWDVVTEELCQVFLGDVGHDFQVTVQADVPLSKDGLDQFVRLTTCYGTPAALSVTDKGDGLYLLSADWGDSSSYQLQLLSPEVRFQDPVLTRRGVGADARMIAFTVPGSNYANVTMAEDILYVPSEKLLSLGQSAICVMGRDPYQAGQVLRLPSGETENHYTVLRVMSPWEAQGAGVSLPDHGDYTCYLLRPATSGEILLQMEARLRRQILANDLVGTLQEQIQQALEADPAVNALADLMIAGAQETEQYQAFSLAQLGSVEQALPASRSTKVRVRVGVNTNQTNPRYFADMAGYTPDDTIFHSVTVQALKEVPVTNSRGDTMVVEVGITLTFWFHVHVDMAVSGTEVIRFDTAVTTLTHTVADLSIQVRSADGKQVARLSGTYESLLDEAAQAADGNPEALRLYQQIVGTGRVTLLDHTAAEVSFTAGPMEMVVPVRLRLELELCGALNGEIELKTGTTAGIRGDAETGFYSYSYHMDPSMKLQQMAMGHSGIRAGVDTEATVRFVGLDALGTLQLQARSGAFTDVYGYHYLDYYRKSDVENRKLSGAYYGQLGLFREVTSQATVLKKQFEDGAYQQQAVLTQLGSRLAVTGMEAEPLVLGDGGLDLAGVRVPVGYLDLVTGSCGRTVVDTKAMAVSFSGPFRMEENRVLYTGKETQAQGVLRLAYGDSSTGFYEAVTVEVPLRYASDGGAVTAAQAQPVCTYRFHVLDGDGREQVATILVPAGVLPQVEHLTDAPEGLRFAGWYDGAVEILTQVRPGVYRYYARYEKE